MIIGTFYSGRRVNKKLDRVKTKVQIITVGGLTYKGYHNKLVKTYHRLHQRKILVVKLNIPFR